MKIIEKIKFTREAGDVQRLHTHRKSGVYTVGIHCYNVASLLKILHPGASSQLIWACLFHDTAERILGDIPEVTKNASWFDKNKLQEKEDKILESFGLGYSMSLEEHHWLTALDTLELLLFCTEQINLGYSNLQIVELNCMGYLRDNPNTPVEVLEVVDALHTYNLPLDERKFYEC